jgi:enamine deaminase RidA (YjgF/YER057c/UK114 family)
VGDLLLRRHAEAEGVDRFWPAARERAEPAVTLVEVSKLYGPDFMIEIEAIAAA